MIAFADDPIHPLARDLRALALLRATVVTRIVVAADFGRDLAALAEPHPAGSLFGLPVSTSAYLPEWAALFVRAGGVPIVLDLREGGEA